MEKGPVDTITHDARYSLSEERLLREQIEYSPVVRIDLTLTSSIPYIVIKVMYLIRDTSLQLITFGLKYRHLVFKMNNQNCKITNFHENAVNLKKLLTLMS